MDVSAPTFSGVERLECHFVAGTRAVATLEDDLHQDLPTRPKVLPPKYFYDKRDSHLFDCVWETPEYCLPHTKDTLLSDSAERIIATAEPDDILDIGRKFTEVAPETMREESKFEMELHFTQEDEAFFTCADAPVQILVSR